MKKTISAVVLLICIATASFSQTDFKKGYIVKLNGDTLHGFINFRKEAQNYTECNFKRFQTAFPVNYSPDKLKAYGIDDSKQYVAVRLNSQFVFVEYLVKGNLSLLFYKQGSQHFYIRDQEGTLVELESGKTTDPKANQTYRHYKEYLLNKMNTVALEKEIQNSKMEVGSLTQLVKQYNELAKYPFEIPQRPSEKSFLKDYSILGTTRLQFGPVGGLSILSFDGPSDVDYNYFSEATFTNATRPVFGLFVSGKVSNSLSNLSFRTEVLFHTASLYGISECKTSYNETSYNELFLSYKNVSLQATINYSISMNKLKLLPHVGLGYKFNINPSYYRFNQICSVAKDVVRTYEYSDLVLPKTYMAYIGGISFNYELFSARTISITFDYVTGNMDIQKTTATGSGTKVKVNGNSLNVTIGLTL